MDERTHIYFASDFHLGAPDYASSLEREKLIVKWLTEIAPTAKEIFLVGDVFDFWFEYRKAIPRGFVRLQGKIAELTDAGIPVHWFTGNHDMWIFDYIPSELGVTMHRDPIQREWNGKKFYIGHGDGLGPGDRGYKLLKKFFRSKFCQWCFARLHPNLGIGLADFFSQKSRIAGMEADEVFLGEDKEWLAIYSREVLEKEHFDYFIFGHRHMPLDISLNEGTSRYVNLGEWFKAKTYAVFDGTTLELKRYDTSGE